MLLYVTTEPINQQLNTVGRLYFQFCDTFAIPSLFERPDVDRLCFFFHSEAEVLHICYGFKG